MQINQQPNDQQAHYHLLPGALQRHFLPYLRYWLWGVCMVISVSLSSALAATTELKFRDGEAALPLQAITDEEGEKRQLSDLKGRPLIVNFWASWCAPCIAELPELEKLAASYTAEQPLVVLVNLDRGGIKSAQPLLETAGVRTPLSLYDPKASWAKQLQIRGLPFTLFIAADQRDYSFHLGPAQWSHQNVKNQLQQQLAFQ